MSTSLNYNDKQLNEVGLRTVVVVPNWNGREWLGNCLDSLANQTAKDFKIVVVDNGSSDGSVELIQSKYSGVELIERERNYGFTGGVNPGMQWAIKNRAEFVALLNNDAQADKRWLEELIRTAGEHPETGIVTAKILYADGKRIDSTGDFYSTWGFSFPRGRGEVDQKQYDKPEQQVVFAGSGGASLYRISMLEEIGLFDQDFFAYFEDIDLSFRAQLAGWTIRYEPKAVVLHEVGKTSSQMGNFARYHTFKNVFWLYHKNMPGWLYLKYLPQFLVGQLLMVGNDVIKLRFGPFVKGYFQVLTKIGLTWRKRSRIQKTRRVSLQYIEDLLYKQLPPTQKRLLKLRQRLSR